MAGGVGRMKDVPNHFWIAFACTSIPMIILAVLSSVNLYRGSGPPYLAIGGLWGLVAIPVAILSAILRNNLILRVDSIGTGMAAGVAIGFLALAISYIFDVLRVLKHVQ